MIQQQPTAIVLDWLSIYCLGTINDTENYTFKLLDYHTRQFSKVYEIYFRSKKIGIVTAEPLSKILNAKALIIKFENSLLYMAALNHFVFKFLKETKLFFKSITRCDIAQDFLRFSNDYHPQQFIRDFFTGTNLKNGRGTFQAIGEQKSKTVYDYLKFGSRLTGRHIYLYNKSKELREVKEKQHIKDYWKLNNLDTGADVWRLEFSFKGAKNKLLDELSGLLTKISLPDLFNFEKLKEIFLTAVNQLFAFKINDGTKNKSRMKDLKLIEENEKTKKLISLPDSSDQTKTQRIILKQLVQEFNSMIQKDSNQAFFIQQCIQVITKKYRLQEFIKNKLGFQFQTIYYSELI